MGEMFCRPLLGLFAADKCAGRSGNNRGEALLMEEENILLHRQIKQRHQLFIEQKAEPLD